MNRLIALVVALAASGSMLAASAFSGPAELFAEQAQQPAAVVTTVDAADDDHSDAFDEERRGRRRLSGVMQRFISGLPFAAKVLIALPLLIIGKCLTALLGAALGLLQAGLAPILAFLGSVLFKFAVLLVIFLLLYKAAFPDKRLRDFFRKGNLICIAAAALFLTAAERILPLVWSGYALARAIAEAVLELIALVLIWYKILRSDGSVAFRARRLLRGRRGVAFGITVVLAVAARLTLEAITAGSIWSFLPEALPFCIVAGVFVVIVYKLRKSWRGKSSPVSLSDIRLQEQAERI